MTEQFEELAQLKNEKEKLLAIQGQLQELHDRFQQVDKIRILQFSNNLRINCNL